MDGGREGGREVGREEETERERVGRRTKGGRRRSHFELMRCWCVSTNG